MIWARVHWHRLQDNLDQFAYMSRVELSAYGLDGKENVSIGLKMRVGDREAPKGDTGVQSVV